MGAPKRVLPDDSVPSVTGCLLTGQLLSWPLTMLIPHHTRRRLATSRCDDAHRPITTKPLLALVLALGLALGLASPLQGQRVPTPIEEDYPVAADVV